MVKMITEAGTDIPIMAWVEGIPYSNAHWKIEIIFVSHCWVCITFVERNRVATVFPKIECLRKIVFYTFVSSLTTGGIEGLGHLMWKSTMFTVQFWLQLWKNVTEEKILAPYDIFEGLSNVHDQVPYEDHSSSHSTINVPKPEAGNKSIIGTRNLEKKIWQQLYRLQTWRKVHRILRPPTDSQSRRVRTKICCWSVSWWQTILSFSVTCVF